MRIAIGCDHRGLEIKQAVMKILEGMGHAPEDCGAYSTEVVDYPDIAAKVGKAVAGGGAGLGILICGTGIGMSIAANKVNGIRAALCYDVFTATRARAHNNANILCLGAATAPDMIRQIVETFLNTAFEGGRHQRRLDKISGMECRP
jgi:ribose 5-phosphate isomerase B